MTTPPPSPKQCITKRHQTPDHHVKPPFYHGTFSPDRCRLLAPSSGYIRHMDRTSEECDYDDEYDANVTELCQECGQESLLDAQPGDGLPLLLECATCDMYFCKTCIAAKKNADDAPTGALLTLECYHSMVSATAGGNHDECLHGLKSLYQLLISRLCDAANDATLAAVKNGVAKSDADVQTHFALFFARKQCSSIHNAIRMRRKNDRTLLPYPQAYFQCPGCLGKLLDDAQKALTQLAKNIVPQSNDMVVDLTAAAANPLTPVLENLYKEIVDQAQRIHVLTVKEDKKRRHGNEVEDMTIAPPTPKRTKLNVAPQAIFAQ